MSSETTKPTILSARHPDVEEPSASLLRQQLLLLVSLRCTAVVIDFGPLTVFYRGFEGDWLSSSVVPSLALFDVIKRVAQPDAETGGGRFGLAFDEVTLLFDVKISGNECEISLDGGNQLDGALAIAAADLLQAEWQERS